MTFHLLAYTRVMVAEPREFRHDLWSRGQTAVRRSCQANANAPKPMERSMNRILIASFSFLVVLGSAQASLSSEESAVSAQNDSLQVSLVKFQSSQQSQLTALDAKVHADLQTIQEQLLSLAQLQSQITSLNKQLQNQANLVISGVDAQVKQLQSSMSQQITEIQNTLNHLAAAKTGALNIKAATAAAAAATEAKAKAAAAKKPGAKKSNAPAS